VIVFGSEGRGASPDIESVARGISVPMSPRVESLNVAAAAAIILAGSYRARRGAKAARP
jgi:TrmH family RNA methyltransferase